MEQRTPPYISFKTFLNALEGMRAHLPNRVDRSQYPSFSGGAVGQLIAALRFFEFVDESGAPTTKLKMMVVERSEGTFGDLLKPFIMDKYRAVVEIGLDRASPKQVEEAMESYGVSGATLRKATRFFLELARYAQVPLAPLLRKSSRARSIRRKERNGTAAAEMFEQKANTTESKSPDGWTRTLKLASDGIVTITVCFDAFKISKYDRNWVFQNLIDKIAEYDGSAKEAKEKTVPDRDRDTAHGITDDDVPF